MADVKKSLKQRITAARAVRGLAPHHFFSGKSDAGFTIIELLVVTAIMVIVTGIVLANNNRFGGKVLLQNLAYDIALSLRQSQIYGVAVHSSQGGSFTVGYGLHFDISSSANSKEYIFFADSHPNPMTPNGYFDTGNNEGIGNPFSINRGYYISLLCVTNSGGAQSCSNNSSLTAVDITFRRPNTEACITPGATVSYNGTKCKFDYQRAKIQVASPRGDTMCINVEATGQISVQNCT